MSDAVAFAASGKNLFAATYASGIFLSTDNGATWSAVNNGIPHRDTWYSYIQISTLISDGSNLYAGTAENGVFLSTNNGTSWNAINADVPLNTHVSAFALSASSDEANTTNIFAGTEGKGIFLTTDDGANWASVNSDLKDATIGTLMFSGTNLFAGTEHGIFLSTNNGTQWRDASTGVLNTKINVLSAGTSNLFAGTDSGLYYSSNNGTSWAMTPLDTFAVTSFAVSPTASGGENLFAGTDKGIFLSTDDGANWVYAGLNTVTAIGVIPNGADGNIIFAGRGWLTWGENGRPYSVGDISRSTDNGVSWTKIREDGPAVRQFVINGNNIFATTTENAFVSTNHGTDWLTIDSGLTDVHALALAPASGGTGCIYMLAGTAEGVRRRPLSEIVSTSSGLVSSQIPGKFLLEQNYPNPFNPATTIEYTIPQQSHVMLKIFDILGREVAVLVNEKKDAGRYAAQWNAARFASGIYFCRIQAGQYQETKRMVLLK